MSYCVDSDELDLSKHIIIGGPWPDNCAGCDVPCVPCEGNISNREGQPCCPQGPGPHGDVHITWNGYDEPTEGFGSIVFFDDNHGGDHYAIDWFEVHKDGTYASIITERRVLCMWPNAPVIKRVIVNGTLQAATVTQSMHHINVDCSECKLTCAEMSTMTIKIDSSKLVDLDSFGGLHWQAMEWLSEPEQIITERGFTGPIGRGQSFSPNSTFRIQNSTPTLTEIMQSGPVKIGYPYSVYRRLTQKAQDIESFKSKGILDVVGETLSRTMAYAGVPRTRQSGESECCGSVDMDFLTGAKCSKCPDDARWGWPGCPMTMCFSDNSACGEPNRVENGIQPICAGGSHDSTGIDGPCRVEVYPLSCEDFKCTYQYNNASHSWDTKGSMYLDNKGNYFTLPEGVDCSCDCPTFPGLAPGAPDEMAQTNVTCVSPSSSTSSLCGQ